MIACHGRAVPAQGRDRDSGALQLLPRPVPMPCVAVKCLKSRTRRRGARAASRTRLKVREVAWLDVGVDEGREREGIRLNDCSSLSRSGVYPS